MDPRLKISHSGCTLVRYFQPQVLIFKCHTNDRIRCQQQTIIFITTEHEYLSLSLRLDEKQFNSCSVALYKV